MPSVPGLVPEQQAQLFLTQLPVYTNQILRDIRPTDGLMGHIAVGTWEPFSGAQHVQDRFTVVKANVSKKWETVGGWSETCEQFGTPPAGQAVPTIPPGCEGSPCDPIENEIAWGFKRSTFGQERQSWKSPFICFDETVKATKAVEHIEQITSEVLRPATSDIGSFYVRKRALSLAENKLLANATMSTFGLTWSTTGNEEIFATVSGGLPTSKLTPEMIQRQIPKMRGMGYFGKWTNDPFWGGYDNFAELLTDDDTCWELDKIAANSRIGDLWRFQMWSAAHEYYKYGMGGQIGNYMTHVDPFCLRFNKLNSTTLQLVLPYRNDVVTVGKQAVVNDDYLNAQYQVSFIWHRFAWRLEVAQLESINPQMPFMVRGLNGQWRFAIDNLGADERGNPISNYRRNKGFFWADFQYAAHPEHTEWLTAILHLREPKVIYVVAPCAADPGYPDQDYSSAIDGCETTFRWLADKAPAQSFSASTTNGDATVTVADTSTLRPGMKISGTGIPGGATILSITNGTTFELSANATATGTPTLTIASSYHLDANSTTCNDEPQDNGVIDATTLALLVTALNADPALGAIGTWRTDGQYLFIDDSSCMPILPWQNV